LTTHLQANIEPATRADIPELETFLMQARAELFPKLSGTGTPADLLNFEEVYLKGGGQFLLVRDEGRIVASIGYLPYDHRFQQLEYRGLKVVEVVRLFVQPGLRRSGLASQLYSALKALAVQAGVEVIYLHTHPFLPGAIDFWRKRDFRVIAVDPDPQWQTTHMEWR
jgi:GNAT superfamily N-acetyltransferase